ncbi:efflux RND transporter periplasmic adaptor subunit [Wukongibacter sp. M2B1]|uniref:efflux RND transporter periplasmic adaptor subunit n=1 Tax=Wukongibacter sp. M2B1 TaxID=3088895 RepID=UPI003D799F41
MKKESYFKSFHEDKSDWKRKGLIPLSFNSLLKIIPILIICISFSACNTVEEISSEVMKPVSILKVKEEKKPITLKYTGIVNSDEMKKVGFKTSGKIFAIPVEKGQRVEKDDILAKLDSKDMEYSARAAKAKMDAALEQYNKVKNGSQQEDINYANLEVKKAEDSYKYALDNYNKIMELYDKGAVTKDDRDRAKLNLDVSEATLNQAKEKYRKIKEGARQEDKNALERQYEEAKIDYEYKQSLLDDMTIKAEMEGYIAEILYEEGEIVSAGYPVIVIQKQENIVNVGLSSKDVEKIEIGDEVKINGDSKDVIGQIENISRIPDRQSRTYNVEISLGREIFHIGDIVEAEFILGYENGIWIPVTAVLPKDGDHVFVIEDGVAKRKNIEIVGLIGSRVQIKGLKQGENLVIRGMNNLIEGDRANIN